MGFQSLRLQADTLSHSIRRAVLEALGCEYPRLIVDVGSFIGFGAGAWGKLVREGGGEAFVLCVDPWSGGMFFHLCPYHSKMKDADGFPKIRRILLEHML